jgi:hypothetical protein
MTDFLLDLADALAADLAASFPTLAVGTASLAVTVERADDWMEKLEAEKLKTPLVQVIDGAETLETERGGLTLEEFELWVIVRMKLPESTERGTVLRALGGLSAAIARRLRPRDSSFYLTVGGEQVPTVKIERNPAKDLDFLTGESAYFTRLVTTWKRY